MKPRPASKILPTRAPAASSSLGDAISSTVFDIVFPPLRRLGHPEPASRSDRQGFARVDVGACPEPWGKDRQGPLGAVGFELEERPVVPRGAGAEQSERAQQFRGPMLLPLALDEI